MKNIRKILESCKTAFDEQKINSESEEYKTKDSVKEEKIKLIKLAISLIDLTTLEGSDTNEKVKELCKTAKLPLKGEKNFPHCACVCIYPNFIKTIKKELKGSGVKTTSVGTAFPSGQYPLKVKLADVKYCVDEKADEIDMVISRGEFLSGNYEYVFREIRKVKKICTSKRKVTLKVILETGELKSFENIYNASLIAIYAGADFIKTSTGKIPVSATLPAVSVMCDAVKKYYEKTKIKVGIKVAGGIRTTEDALSYISLVKDKLGDEWLTPKLFRIGASSLLNDLLTQYKALKLN